MAKDNPNCCRFLGLTLLFTIKLYGYFKIKSFYQFILKLFEIVIFLLALFEKEVENCWTYIFVYILFSNNGEKAMKGRQTLEQICPIVFLLFRTFYS